MKPVTQKSLLAECDAIEGIKIGGTEVYRDGENINSIVQNYSTAYYENVTDTVFLLDVQQLYNVYANCVTLGDYYYYGKTYLGNWLRTPSNTEDNSVNCVTNKGSVGGKGNFANGAKGVRPAFYLDLPSVVFLSGTGTSEDPYSNVASSAVIDEIPDQTYTGSAITPVVTVKDGETTLEKGTEYTVTYSNNTNVGTATVTVTGIGNYSGTITTTFNIIKATPAYTVPANLTATEGQTLNDVPLPDGWNWDAPGTSVGKAGEHAFSATFTPTDPANYNTVTVTLTVTVTAAATYYTIAASAGNGGSIDPSGNVSVRSSNNAVFTITPDAGYEVADVLVDGASMGAVSAYTFETVSKDYTIEARFRKRNAMSGCPRDNTCPIAAFSDAVPTAWYHDGVHFCLEEGLMIGTSATTFAPEMDTSRAMIAVVLWRQAGSPAVNYALPYDDVAEGVWYTEGVRWATSAGVALGYGNGKFGPNDPITREQLAAMLYRYEQTLNSGLTGDRTSLMDFNDMDKISDWAYEAMCWMTTNGIIEGKGNKTLDPQGLSTRAEVAAVLMRYCENIKNS